MLNKNSLRKIRSSSRRANHDRLRERQIVVVNDRYWSLDDGRAPGRSVPSRGLARELFWGSSCSLLRSNSPPATFFSASVLKSSAGICCERITFQFGAAGLVQMIAGMFPFRTRCRSR